MHGLRVMPSIQVLDRVVLLRGACTQRIDLVKPFLAHSFESFLVHGHEAHEDRCFEKDVAGVSYGVQGLATAGSAVLLQWLNMESDTMERN